MSGWIATAIAVFGFAIRTLSDDRLIGDIGVWIESWAHGEAWVGIGLGERDYWGNGYGTDAMRLMLRFAFDELNLQRVSLGVYAYNPRAIRSYEKAGFRREGSGARRLPARRAAVGFGDYGDPALKSG